MVVGWNVTEQTESDSHLGFGALSKYYDAVRYRNELWSNEMKGNTAILIGESSCLSKFRFTALE